MGGRKQEVLDVILDQLEAVFDRWYKGDPYGWLDLMDDEMSYFSPFVNKILDGKEAVVANVAPIEGQIHVPRFEILNPDLKLGEEIGILTYRIFEYGDGEALSAAWKVTEGFRQVGDRWRLIHSHFSAVSEIE